MKDILVCVVNYANEKEVYEYALSLSKQTISENITLVITNNKSNKDTTFDLNNMLKKVKLEIFSFEPNENLGYLNGCLYGYNKYSEITGNSPQWVFISNTDIIINDIFFFEKIRDKNYDKVIWCIAPSVYSTSNNSYDNPHYKKRYSLSKVNRIIWVNERPLIAFFYEQLAKIKAKYTCKEKEDSQEVYSVHGCFLGLRKEFMDNMCKQWYEGFLYSEEAYIAEKLRELNKKTYYDSSIEVIHNENSVTGLLSVKKRAEYISYSMKYIRNTFFEN